MSYLWAGGEDIDFPNGFNPSVSTTSGRFRAGYARCCLFSGSTTVGHYSASTPFPGGAVTSCWLSFILYNVNTSNFNSSSGVVGLGQSGQGGKGIYLGYNSSSQLSVYRYDGTTSTQISTASPGLSGGIQKLDVQIVNYGSSATVNIFINGALILTYSGNIAISGITGFDTVLIGWGFDMEFSEFIVASADTRSVQGLVTLAPNGNGTTQNWSNPAYTNFNPTTINDANSTFVNTTGQDEQATLSDLPSGNFSVPMVKIASRAMASSGSASTNLQQGVKNGSTVAVGSSHALTTAFSTYEDYFTTDPTTSNPWLVTDINGLQLDLRSA